MLILGSALPRKNNLATQYFARLLGEPGEGPRIIYTESIFEEPRASTCSAGTWSMPVLANLLQRPAADDARPARRRGGGVPEENEVRLTCPCPGPPVSADRQTAGLPPACPHISPSPRQIGEALALLS